MILFVSRKFQLSLNHNPETRTHNVQKNNLLPFPDITCWNHTAVIKTSVVSDSLHCRFIQKLTQVIYFNDLNTLRNAVSAVEQVFKKFWDIMHQCKQNSLKWMFTTYIFSKPASLAFLGAVEKYAAKNIHWLSLKSKLD